LRVILPWTVEHPEVLAALEDWPVERVYVGSDDECYFRLISDLWHSGDTFAIVEHDMVPAPGILREFEVCPQEWCAEEYFMWGTWGTWFGVVRFRGSLTRRHPDLPESIVNRNWHSLDSTVINHLRLLGYPESHWHWPAAKHLRPIEEGFSRFQCNYCGSALDIEALRRDPKVVCACGEITFMPFGRTMTDAVL
jgi:hypothetical protein